MIIQINHSVVKKILIRIPRFVFDIAQLRYFYFSTFAKDGKFFIMPKHNGHGAAVVGRRVKRPNNLGRT